MAKSADDAKQVDLKGADQLVARSRTLSQRVATYNQRLVAEGDALADEIKSLRKIVSDRQRAAAAPDADVSPEEAEQLALAQSIVEGHGPGGDLRKLAKQPNPALLQLLLGSNTNVVTLQRNQAIRLKEEYHAFRDHVGITLFGAAALLLVGLSRAQARAEANEPLTLTPPFMVGVQLLLCWLLYCYTAMALRENVLKVNGSNIRRWWIHHHYWSIAICMLMLTLPVDSPTVQKCITKFLWWTALQGLVMMVQNRYQRRRMYTRIALGKNRPMDVVTGESSGSYGQLYILYPLLFGLQALQFWIGFEMVRWSWQSVLLTSEGYLDMEKHESDLRGSRGVFLIGVVLVAMAITNFRNTVATMLEKNTTRRAKTVGGRPKVP